MNDDLHSKVLSHVQAIQQAAKSFARSALPRRQSSGEAFNTTEDPLSARSEPSRSAAEPEVSLSSFCTSWYTDKSLTTINCIMSINRSSDMLKSLMMANDSAKLGSSQIVL